ncbi:EYxxD motif small membrane protein [Caldalkalibacillus salinus]|nr:EYxxD motif small membrane protein [Caldalkalibacillus salinus]
MEGHALWQYISHNAYVILTVVGVIVVLALVYQGRQRAKKERKQRARE